MDLFDYDTREATKSVSPLADRMRPKSISEFIGQRNVVGRGTLIRRAIENDRVFSMIFWGPPGCGKTTLAGIIARETHSHFVAFSAVLSGVKQIRAVIEEAKRQQKFFRKRTILFVDEIHRFNKAQQDAFLHHVESGLITLIGATTENPSFEVIPALISRCRIVTLKRLEKDDLVMILQRAVKDKPIGLGLVPIVLDKKVLHRLADLSDGDARSALNSLEAVADMAREADERTSADEPLAITMDMAEKLMERKTPQYDKSGEYHYNLISAFHKSLRGSDPDASVYWLARMLAGGEDPFYILRRMVRFASEDIGNADPQALAVALNASETYRLLGHPEGELAMAQAAIYLATAPKSNSVYSAFEKIQKIVDQTGTLAVPLHIRNAPTKLMKDLGYGKGYRYAHHYKGGWVRQNYLPDQLKDRHFYFPTERGFEKIIKQRVDRWRGLKPENKNDKRDGKKE